MTLAFTNGAIHNALLRVSASMEQRPGAPFRRFSTSKLLVNSYTFLHKRFSNLLVSQGLIFLAGETADRIEVNWHLPANAALFKWLVAITPPIRPVPIRSPLDGE